MNKNAAGVLVVLGCLMLMAGGCAKQELVKKDETIAPAVSPAKAPVKAEAVIEQPVKKDVVAQQSFDGNAQASARAAQLQASLQKIYFDFDSFKLSDEARATLAKNAESIRKDAADNVRIEGNCDERGSDEYNLALGERRAKAAMAYLSTMGVPADRLSYITYGEEKPVDPGHNEDAWAKNRRDDFVVVTK
jgi:peptidoglycan-associated lipoprotein